MRHTADTAEVAFLAASAAAREAGLGRLEVVCGVAVWHWCFLLQQIAHAFTRRGVLAVGRCRARRHAASRVCVAHATARAQRATPRACPVVVWSCALAVGAVAISLVHFGGTETHWHARPHGDWRVQRGLRGAMVTHLGPESSSNARASGRVA